MGIIFDAFPSLVGIISFSITRLKHLRKLKPVRDLGWVGIISFSITRLKRRRKCPCLRFRFSWNHKFLDYEIETAFFPCQSASPTFHKLSWNHKFLDYEIETSHYQNRRLTGYSRGWNHKFLDYEIETFTTACTSLFVN